jgi:hypothetical protein
MDEVKAYLEERGHEINTHLKLLLALEKRSTETHDDDFDVDIRQVLILKASILVHLYNVVESTMAKSLEVMEVAIHSHHPKDYTEALFDEWVVANLRVSNEVNTSKLNSRAQVMGKILLGNSGWSKLSIQKTDGNWDDKRIISFTKKLGIMLSYPRSFKAALSSPYYDDLSKMEYIRKRRNDLAHGFVTFESGADNKTHEELAELATITMKFMGFVVGACHSFISNNKFLKDTA